ncbi:MAG: hypothetical protein JJT76_18720 [Clostridiaceae bacterium]|nr:hypothetical protein [Clostridiaceae bacterium]
MWNITYDLNKMVPPIKSGYEFVKTIKLFIPHKEIGLKTLVRKEQPLPIFYEAILKLIDCKCNEIIYISEIIGVEEEILNDVIGEMSRLDLVYVKSHIITLTPKGKIALSELRKTVIEKEEINRIYINSITGKIVDLKQSAKKPTYKNPCLDEVIKITDEFITSNFNNFNDYYQKRQEEYEGKGQHAEIKNEIYQIIGKEYEELCYSEEKAFVYKNIRDNDLIYQCENDPENVYGNTLARQISNRTGTRNFLDMIFHIDKYLKTEVEIDTVKKENTEKLIQAIGNSSHKKDMEEIEKCYFADRYLLEKEYMDILVYIRNIKPSEIIISSGSLFELLEHNVIAALQESLDNTKVSIMCDTKDKRVKQLKGKVMNHKLKKKNKIQWLEIEEINETNIILYPDCAINIKYLPIPVGKDYLNQEVAEITFNNEKVSQLNNKFAKVFGTHTNNQV